MPRGFDSETVRNLSLSGVQDMRPECKHLGDAISTRGNRVIVRRCNHYGSSCTVNDYQILIPEGFMRTCDGCSAFEPPPAESESLQSERRDLVVERGGAIFSHPGDCGDLIYHLSAIRAIGGGHLRLFPSGTTSVQMSLERVANLRRLLEAQPYILSVAYSEGPQGLNLDRWRWHENAHLNLSDTAHEWLHLEHWPRNVPWLDGVEPLPVAPVVFCRTLRYNNSRFPWPAVFDKYGKDAVFLGSPEEHKALIEQFGPVPYYPTEDLYEAARIIAGSRLVIVNQTSIRAVTEGLKKAVVVEVDPRVNNTHFERSDAYYGVDESVTLPDIK